MAFNGLNQTSAASPQKAPSLRILERVVCAPSPDHTQVRLECDRQVSYVCSTLPGDTAKGLPQRVYCDLSSATSKKEVPRHIPIDQGPLQGVRIGQFDAKTVRVVFDVRDLGGYEISCVSSPFTIVVDLWSTKKVSETDERTSLSASSEQPSPTQTGSASRSEKGAQKSAPSRMQARRPSSPSMPRIVIDPGHGGDDPGAIGPTGLKEKDVTLRIAKMLKARLNAAGNPHVFLTRHKDIYVSLKKRTAIANAKNADIFISIHTNGHSDPSVSGVETYYLDNTTDRAAIRLAAFENASVGHSLTDVQRILMALRRNSNVLESNALAHAIQDSLVKALSKKFKGVNDNGAKANLFYVLLGAEMPSVLVEVSYITNPREEARLRDEQYLGVVVEGIYGVVKGYLSQDLVPTIQAMR